MNINNKYLAKFIKDDEFNHLRANADSVCSSLLRKEYEMTGWIDYANNISENEIKEINDLANKCASKNKYLVVIGVGGSYLGAAAALKLLNKNKRVIFVGTNIDEIVLDKILKKCEQKDFVVNVVSKSGGTFETILLFDMFKKLLKDKYGKKYHNHIICTTGVGGKLYQEAKENNYYILNVPDDIGGRFSVLTPVGLFPMAFAGVNIAKVITGAANFNAYENCVFYAATRKYFYSDGKNIELFAGFAERFELFNEWLKQLFAESEGKDGEGLFPASVIFSRDLHSVGQYIQDGKKQIIETFITVKNRDHSNNRYIDWDSINKIQDVIYEASAKAHYDGDVPVNIIEIDRLDEKSIGEIFYFFELSCAISATMLGVNPFNQPGVEEYKKNMRELL